MSDATLQFISNSVPALEAGNYTITVSQDIQGIDTEGYFDQDLTQDFRVEAPQFNLDPQLVHGAYPAPGSTGDFAEVLPQIVLERSSLPWEREITTDTSKPWLALLVFQEDEISVDNETNSTTTTMKVSELLTADPNAVSPGIDPNSLTAEVLDMNCEVLTVRGQVFENLIPYQEDISFLAHARTVDSGDQVAAGADGSGEFAVVMANRFPQADPSTGGASGSKNYVHLVSLEGLYEYLQANPALGYKSIDPSMLKDVRMVSLYSWSFVASPEGQQSFEALATGLVDHTATPDSSYLLKLPYEEPASPDAATQTSMDMLGMGYVPLSYETVVGENTFAWYRGPLTAAVAQPLPKEVKHYASSSAATIYNRDYGVFDLSYAAAWEIGRAAALADSNFGSNLLRFRRISYQVINQLMDQLDADNLDSVQDLASIVSNGVVRDAFDDMITADISGQLQVAFKASPSRKGRTRRQRTVSTDPVEDTTAFLQNPEVLAVLAEAVDEYLMPVADWLARLKLLYMVPFNHLVADQAMLPPESIRFFYVDQNWLNTVMDGALSLGLESSRDSFFYQTMKDVIDDAVDAEMQDMRSKLAGTSTGEINENSSSIEAMSGILIRSEMVNAWSGLEVRGLENSTQLKTLRMERLSNNVLLVLFLDTANQVEIAQPQQGLQFGVESNAYNDWIIYLRNLSGDHIGQASSTQFPSSGGFASFYRTPTDKRVLNINEGSGSLVSQLGSALGVQLSPAQFALQMVRSPELLYFNY